MDEYKQWRDAVAADAPGILDAPPGVAVVGFYRHRTTSNPVAVWREPEGLMAQTNNMRPVLADEVWCERVFAYCQPVPEPWYRQARADGIWPDHQVTRQHNKPPEGLTDTILQLDDLRMEAQQILNKGEAQTQADADLAANLVARMNKLVEGVDESMRIAVAPFEAQIREIDAQRRPIVQQLQDAKLPYENAVVAAKGTIARLKTAHIEPFLKRVRDAARAAMAATGAAPGAVSMRDGTTKLVTNAGGKGAKVSLVTRWWAEIEDYEKAYAALKDHPDIRAKVQQICDAAARSKARIPIAGVAFKSEEKVR